MHRVLSGEAAAQAVHTPTYSGRMFSEPVPKLEIPEHGMDADAAYQLVHDELNLDGNPALNLASFVTSWMEPQADRLAAETLDKNLIDQDEYPQSEAIHRRVVNMLGRLFHAPAECEPVGTATIGSSEAIMLALLAHKRTWRNRRHAAGEPAEHPNLIVGADVHTCWEKFTRYFEVEARIAPLSEDSFTLSAADVRERLDENTIAVGGLLGTTFTGQMDALGDINELLAERERAEGWAPPLHIDGASGGFIAPFTDPGLEWDFRLSQVRSINVSNHKFGLVYPGMGSVIFRDVSDLPEELIFHINYLGGDMPNYSLNFSRPSNSVILQYYNFLRLGRDGYRRVMETVMDTAGFLRQGLADSAHLDPIGEGDRFPIIAVRAADPERVDVFAISDEIRKRGWIVPAYTLPPAAEHVAVLRMVVKENLSRDMAALLLDDIDAAVAKQTGEKGSRAASAWRGKARQPVC